MGFFTREPNVELIALQLVQLIAAYKRTADEQVRKLTEEEEKKTGITPLVIMGLHVKDLVPDARTIITRGAAKWFDSTFDHAVTIVSNEVLQSIPPEHVDFYLELVMLTMESWLGGKNRVQAWILLTGSDYHTARGEMFVNTKQWELAEAEFRKASEYDEEAFPFSGGLVMSLANIGLLLHFQQRDYEAMEFFEKAIEAFLKLKSDAISYDKAKEGYELAKALLQR